MDFFKDLFLRIYELFNIHFTIFGYDMCLWHFLVIDVVLGGMAYAVGKFISTNS